MRDKDIKKFVNKFNILFNGTHLSERISRVIKKRVIKYKIKEQFLNESLLYYAFEFSEWKGFSLIDLIQTAINFQNQNEFKKAS